jgi:hypothetical protein
VRTTVDLLVGRADGVTDVTTHTMSTKSIGFDGNRFAS